MTIVYDPLTYRTVVARPGEIPYKFWSVNKHVIDAASAGICTLHSGDEAPGDTTKLWLDLTLPENAVGAVKAYDGASWVALTPALFYSHIAGGAGGFVTDLEMATYVSGLIGVSLQAWGENLDQWSAIDPTAKEDTGVAATLDAAHLAAGDPHPQYLTAAEGAAAYQPLGGGSGVIGYASIAALAAAQGGAVNMAVLLGRSTPGDGGGDTFVWLAGNQTARVSADPQTALYVPPASDVTGASGCWARQTTGRPLAITCFGVVSGTGLSPAQVVTNTAAMQAAVNSGMPLYVPSGVHLIDHVELPATTTLLGAGPDAIIRKSGTTRNLFERDLATASVDFFTRDVTFDGDCDNQLLADWDTADSLIYSGANTGRVIVENCRILNPTGRGIYVRSDGSVTATKVRIDGCVFNGGREAVMDAGTPSNSKTTQYCAMVDVSEYSIASNTFDIGFDPVGYGLSAIVATTFNTTNTFQPIKGIIHGNSFDRCGQGGSVSGAGALGVIDAYNGGGRTIITSNRLYRSTSRGINVKCDGGDVIIANNIVYSSINVVAANTDTGPAIVVNGSVEATGSVENNYIITGNLIRNIPKDGIFITGDAVYSANYAGGFLVDGNIVDGITGSGIVVSLLNDAVVRGNTVKNVSVHGIRFSGVQNSLVIDDNTVDGYASYGIGPFAAGNGTHALRISNNVVRGNPAASLANIRADTAGEAYIGGNDVDGSTQPGIAIVSPGAFHHVCNNKIGANVSVPVSVTGTVSNVAAANNVSRKVGTFGSDNVSSVAGVLSIWRDWHYVSWDTTNITSILGGYEGMILTLITGQSGVTIADGTNLKMLGNWVGLSNGTITLMLRNAIWYEIARSANG